MGFYPVTVKRIVFWRINTPLATALGPGVKSAFSRNEYQESSGGRGEARPAHEVHNLTTICKSTALTSHNPMALHDLLQG
jgi:hypothetical protein